MPTPVVSAGAVPAHMLFVLIVEPHTNLQSLYVKSGTATSCKCCGDTTGKKIITTQAVNY